MCIFLYNFLHTTLMYNCKKKKKGDCKNKHKMSNLI